MYVHHDAFGNFETRSFFIAIINYFFNIIFLKSGLKKYYPEYIEYCGG